MICRLSSRGENLNSAKRVFSGAKHTISDQWANLKSETVELLKCLKSWFRAGIFTEEDLHAIVGTMAEGAVEALENLDEALDYQIGPVRPVHLLDGLPLDQLGLGPTGPLLGALVVSAYAKFIYTQARIPFPNAVI